MNVLGLAAPNRIRCIRAVDARPIGGSLRLRGLVVDRSELFWRHVARGDGCWEWTGSTNASGYGTFAVGRGRMAYAHRFSWELHFGPIPSGLFVCHHCDNRPCVRPDHLFVGTAADNARDMLAKGRSFRRPEGIACRRGHPADASNLYLEPGRWRLRCRTCGKARALRQAAKRKAARAATKDPKST